MVASTVRKTKGNKGGERTKHEAWEDDRKRVIEKNDKLENDKRKVYALILGSVQKL